MRLSSFKKLLLSYFRPEQNSIFNVHDPHGLKLLARLLLVFSHLKEHKCRHNFTDSILPLCNCGLLEAETNEHFLLRCPLFSSQGRLLLDNFPTDLSSLSDSEKTRALLYGHESLTYYANQELIKNTIHFLKTSKRFDMPLIGH